MPFRENKFRKEFSSNAQLKPKVLQSAAMPTESMHNAQFRSVSDLDFLHQPQRTAELDTFGMLSQDNRSRHNSSLSQAAETSVEELNLMESDCQEDDDLGDESTYKEEDTHLETSQCQSRSNLNSIVNVDGLEQDSTLDIERSNYKKFKVSQADRTASL